MAKITIDGQEYDTENLPEQAISIINSIVAVDSEIQRMQNLIKIHNAARKFYGQQLQEILNKQFINSIGQ